MGRTRKQVKKALHQARKRGWEKRARLEDEIAQRQHEIGKRPIIVFEPGPLDFTAIQQADEACQTIYRVIDAQRHGRASEHDMDEMAHAKAFLRAHPNELYKSFHMLAVMVNEYQSMVNRLANRIQADKNASPETKRLAAKYKAIAKLNQEKAKLPRTRDALSPLLRRTYKALQAKGQQPKPRKVIEALGQYDEENILRANPQASGMYGNPPDPKRTYWNQKSKTIYWSSKGADRQCSEAQIRERLRSIR